MKYLFILILFICSQAMAQEVFVVKYKEGTQKAEEYKLIAKDGKFELSKKAKKKTKKVHISLPATKRLTESLTKISFKEKSQQNCSLYLSFTLEGQSSQVCQEDRELTKEAVQLMYQLNHMF